MALPGLELPMWFWLVIFKVTIELELHAAHLL